MSNGILTSADATVMLNFPDIFNGGIFLDRFAADRGWDFEQHTIAQGEMAMTGQLSRAYIPTPINVSFHIQADADCVRLINTAYGMSVNNQASYNLSAQIRLKQAAEAVELIDGFMVSWTPGASASKILESRVLSLQFTKAIPINA